MKITKIKIIISSLIICALFLFGVWHSKHAQFTHEKMIKLVEKQVVKVLDQINTTPDQKQQIIQISNQIKTEANDFRKQSKTRYKGIFNELLSDNSDSTKLHADIDKSIDHLRQFGHSALDNFIKIHKILSPEQRADLKIRFESTHGNSLNSSS